jgi:hypothetical protein
MKVLVIALAFVAGPALACPADGSKDADAAPYTGKAVVASSTAKPATAQARAAKQKPAAAKVAVRSAADASKAAPL